MTLIMKEHCYIYRDTNKVKKNNDRANMVILFIISIKIEYLFIYNTFTYYNIYLLLYI